MPEKILLAGAGSWGSVHARKLARRQDAELVAIWDHDADRAAALAAEVGCPRTVHDAADLPAGLDAAVVAVSTEAHGAVARSLLERGVPVLLEKPLSATPHSAVERAFLEDPAHAELLHAAMIERFNPAFTAVRDSIGDCLFVQVERLAPFSPRSLDTDVVFDLMIHDLDLVLDLVDGAVDEVRAVGGPVLTGQPDMAHVRLEFDTGCVAVLASSRASFKGVRSLRTFGPAGYHSVDLLEHRAHRASRERDAEGKIQISVQPVDVPETDALNLQHDTFLERVRLGVGDPGGLRRARRALDLAARIQSSIHSNLDRWLES